METEPQDRELYDEVLGYLAAEGRIEEEPERGIVVLHAFEQRDLDPPMRWHVTPASLGSHLREAADDAAGVFPDAEPIEAAWRLLTVHLMEAVLAAKPGETELHLDRTGVIARRG